MFQNSVTDFKKAQDELFRKGFLTIDNFVDTKNVEVFLRQLEMLEPNAQKEKSIYPYIYRDSNGNPIVMNRIELADMYFYDFAREKFILDFGLMLLGKPIIPLSVEYFSKAPCSKTITPPHQDQVFYEDHFDDELAITFWIALDDINENNGALEYSIPDGLTLLPHKASEVAGFSFELESNAIEILPPFQKAIVPKGGCIIHHAYSVHKASVNSTNHFRRALALTYRTSSYQAHYAT